MALIRQKINMSTKIIYKQISFYSLSSISSYVLSFVFSGLVLFLSPKSLGDAGTNSSTPKGFHDRAMVREKGRWSLSEWLEQKDRNRMMDLWLSFNSPSPFEAMLGIYSINSKSNSTNTGSTTSGVASQELSGTNQQGEIRLYAQAVGLTFEHINSSSLGFSNLLWLFNLRLFGNSLQNSSLVLSVGKQELYFYSLKSGVSNYIGQVGLQIFLKIFWNRLSLPLY